MRVTHARRAVLFAACFFGCSGTQSAGSPSTGGFANGGDLGTGGTNSLAAGGTNTTGGAPSSSGVPIDVGGQSSGGDRATGRTAAGGKPTTSDNPTGGAPPAGGSNTIAGATARGTGGSPPAGGSVGIGGATPIATGGAAPKGGSTPIGGNSSSNGTLGTGGKSTGGVATSGGTKAIGGAQATGGSESGGATATDRCDVGVYDSANPPQALTLSGNLGAHDPSAIFQASNGTYYEFQTGLGAKTSTNLTTWSAASVPFTAPSWMKTSIPDVGDLWAPDISYFNGQYHLYYAGSTFGSNQSCIGHATRASLNSGSWADQGSVICSNVGTTDNWNAIDPNVIIDTDGTAWLDFGSFWSGIKIIKLDQNGARSGANAPTAIAARPNNGGALEGPFIVRRCGYYYLFTSWDTCCKGADSTYNIRVTRSTSVTGPYTDKAGTAANSGGGTLIAQGNSTWAGPGGQSVMLVGTKAYLVYHAYTKSNGTATLRIADLVWDSSGWPMPVGP